MSGVAAAFLSVRREFVGEPDRVKQIIMDNCTDLKRIRTQQGAGMVNLTKMLLRPQTRASLKTLRVPLGKNNGY